MFRPPVLIKNNLKVCFQNVKKLKRSSVPLRPPIIRALCTRICRRVKNPFTRIPYNHNYCYNITRVQLFKSKIIENNRNFLHTKLCILKTNTISLIFVLLIVRIILYYVRIYEKFELMNKNFKKVTLAVQITYYSDFKIE